MQLSQDERQKFLELINKVSPCAVISEKENLEKLKEWLDSDRSKRAKNNEIVCWHWTHGQNANEIRFLEIQKKCKDCGKYHFSYIKDWNQCDQFITKYPNKEWSDICKPILN